jgi:hypothetical protein
VNCSLECGNISVPFPFGVEEGCSARKTFQLNCSNTTPPILQHNFGTIIVTYINVSEGLLGVKYDSSIGEALFNSLWEPLDTQGPNLYVDPLESTSVRWAAANLTCQEAKKNTSGYACVSIHSSCLGVLSSINGYVGYRCACLHGFQGNPYIADGCEGTLIQILYLQKLCVACPDRDMVTQILMSAYEHQEFAKAFARTLSGTILAPTALIIQSMI